eukprot:7702108-Lingulodinium_polyedra.AAC.1
MPVLGRRPDIGYKSRCSRYSKHRFPAAACGVAARLFTLHAYAGGWRFPGNSHVREQQTRRVCSGRAIWRAGAV